MNSRCPLEIPRAYSALTKRANRSHLGLRGVGVTIHILSDRRSTPIRFGCCARAGSANATVAPPRSVTKSRRFIASSQA
jgi:hypothetical protein